MRKGSIERKTKETKVKLGVALDGKGLCRIKTGVPFFDHMLCLMGSHGRLDLSIAASGDIEVDFHHLVEDVGICLGKAVNSALGKKAGIKRFGFAAVPMDESLAMACVDISGRGLLVFNSAAKKKAGGAFDLELAEEFFGAFARNAGITLHINLVYGKNLHHMVEAVFKAAGRAVRQAVRIDKGAKGIPSTKGIL